MTSDSQQVRIARRMKGIQYAVRDVVSLARERAAAGGDLIFLNIGDPCQFDFKTPGHVIEAIIRALRDDKTSYTASEGLAEAREAVRRDASERQGILGVRDVFTGNGASELIEALLTALLDPGEAVLVPRPGYPLYTAVLGKLEARGVYYDLDERDGWHPDADRIEDLVDCTDDVRAIVLINPNNPTGSVTDRATLEQILDIAARRNLLVISDEIYDQLLIDDVEMVATASLRDDVVIATFGGLSKVWLGPGLRMGWCILSGPEHKTRTVCDALAQLLRARLSASHPVQFGVKPALEGPMDHVAEVNTRLRERRDVMVEQLEAIPGWSLAPPQGAFYAFPKVELGIPDTQVVRELIMDHGVVLVHGSGFGAQDPNHVRLVFLPPPDLLREAFSRIGTYSARYA